MSCFSFIRKVKGNSRACGCDVQGFTARHSRRNFWKRNGTVFRILTGLSFSCKTDDFVFCAPCEIFSGRIFKIDYSHGRNRSLPATDVFNVVMFIQGTEKVCLVALVLLIGSVEFKMLKSDVHESAAVKKHITKTICFFTQTVA